MYITHDWSDSFRFGTTYLAKPRESSARCCTEVYPWQLDRLIRRIKGISWECVWCTKFYTVHTFTFHVESQFICYKMIRFLLLGMAVKLTHFARDVKIVTRTPGVSFTGVLAINNCPHCKLFERVTLECFTRCWSLWSFAWPTNSLSSMHLGYKTNCEKCQGHHTALELWILKLKKS